MTTAEARLEADAAGVGMGLVSCHVNGVSCWIVRTDRNNLGVGDHPLTLVQVIATAHLRTQLNLHDGDEVTLHIERQQQA